MEINQPFDIAFPLVVNDGGTGRSSFTPYAIITGGITSTGALQQVASLGTSGQVLTSSGSSALPIWTTPTTGTVTSVSGTANRITSSGGTTPVIDISASYVGQSSITTLGTIATGTWNASVITGTYGGTGINNGTKTFTYLKNISFTAADDTGVYTLPTGTKTLVATDVATLSSLTSIGTIGTGVWQGTKIGLNYGGTNADLSVTGGTSNYLKQASIGAAITVGTIPASDIASGQALTKTDDTNVTLTLGGTPTTALLTAASLTLGWTGTLAVSRGGTGGGSASITLFNNITGYTAAGATGTTSTNLVFSTSPTLTTPTIASLIGNKIYPSADSTTAIQILKADAATSILTVDTTNSRVGIGTTPNVSLEINAPATAGTIEAIRVGNTNTGAGSGASINFYAGAGNKEASIYTSAVGSNKGDLRLATSNGTNFTDALTILGNNQYVGIGTTAPAALLHIVGGATSDEMRIGQDTSNYYKIGRSTSTGALDYTGTQSGFTGYTFNGPVSINNTTISSGFMLDITANTNTSVTGFRVTNNNTGTNVQIQNQLMNAAGSLAYYGITDASYNTVALLTNRAFFGSNAVDTLIFTQSAHNLVFATNSTENMRIVSGGNVTIGSTTSTSMLNVGSSAQWQINSSGLNVKYNGISTVSNGQPSELATIDSTGLTANVGASTLYAVPSTGAGMYRVSAYVVTTTAASLSSTMPNVQVVYTDKDSNTSVTLDVTPVLGAAGLGQSGLLTANTAGTVFSGEVPIYVKASTTIQYQTVNYASNLAGMAYALHMKLECL